MTKVLPTLALILFTTCAMAQKADLYLSIDDYVNGNFVQKEVAVELQKQTVWFNGNAANYIIRNEEDDTLTKQLKEEYKLVRFKDTLYINCKLIRTKGYARVFYESDGLLYFIGPPSYVNGSDTKGDLIGGLAGAAIGTSSATDNGGYHYAINKRSKNPFAVGNKFMKLLMGKNNAIYKRYKQDKQKHNTDVLITYLNEFYRK